MYVLDKHIHAHELSNAQIVTPQFIPPCTCLAINSKKKIALAIYTLQITGSKSVVPLCLQCIFDVPSLCLRILPPFQVRFKSVSNPFRVRSSEWAKNGTYIGVAREEQGSCLASSKVVKINTNSTNPPPTKQLRCLDFEQKLSKITRKFIPKNLILYFLSQIFWSSSLIFVP